MQEAQKNEYIYEFEALGVHFARDWIQMSPKNKRFSEISHIMRKFVSYKTDADVADKRVFMGPVAG
ncbi:MAG: hypothetical protein ACYSSP_09290 [Planctomycetota bacterium]|jgi:hypothetical protein